MLPMHLMREFMLPYYTRMTDFCKGKGVDTIIVDTDGNCWDIIPFFLECGANGLYPFEVNCTMDVRKVRELYPDLIIGGGIPKSDLALGPARIDQLLDDIAPVLKSGRYVPFCDHFIPPEVSFENFKYYREKLNVMIGDV